jgi:starch synthase (maltosyl-transferring)
VAVVNLDPHRAHSGWLELPLDQFGLGGDCEVRDLLTDKTYAWNGPRIYIELNPRIMPAHVFQLRNST